MPNAKKPETSFPSYKTAKTEDLIPYSRNARTHSDAQVAQIAASIREFGFTNPILVDGEHGVIAGHGRLLAARKLGLTEVPTIELAHLSDAQRRAYILADNRLALSAGWDDDMLKIELGELKIEGFDLTLTGFDDNEIAALLNDGEEGLTDPDDVPEAPINPVSVLGDVWILGRHRLACGSCTDVGLVERIMGGRQADICLTDPPYGLGDSNSEKNDYAEYKDTAEGLVDLIAEFLPLAQSIAPVIVLTPGVANVHRYPKPNWIMAWFTPAGVGSGPWGFCCWQPILCFGKDPKLSKGKGRHPDALVHTESGEKNGHPCAKPIKFWSWLMERTSEPGALIYEPFSGSGTTLMAAEMTGRNCNAIELSPIYVDIAVKRWEEFTGKKAVNESDGRTFSEVSENGRQVEEHDGAG